MREYDFVLKFSLGAGDTDPEGFVEKLAESGCDDALADIGKTGRIALDFTREASSAMEAVASAIRDVKRAIPAAKLVEATPDLMGLTDMAEILNFSRQNMRKLMLNTPNFPAPIHEGKPSIWHLVDILRWLKDRGKYRFDDSLLELAAVTRRFNVVKEVENLDPPIPANLDALLG